MDFSWSEEQQALRRSVTQFAQSELVSDLIEEDRKQEFSWEGWRQCARFGIQGLLVPEEYGGGGADILTAVCALEGLAYGCRNNGLIFSLNAHMWGSEIPLLAFGTAEQKRKYLPRLASGEWVGAKAVEEPSTGPVTRAGRRNGGWVLNGSKAAVSNAPLADVVMVFAAVESAEGPSGLTAFIVEKSAPGFAVGRTLEKMGLRTSPLADLALVDCEVPEQSLLGEIGGGAAILAASTEWERICLLAGELGMMQRQLETSARYASERRQFGQPIGKFPAVATKVADMDIRLETSRLLLYKAAWLKQQGRNPLREAAIAKAYVADAAIQTCRDAVQIHGGYGYMTEYQIERELRDAVSEKIYSGTTEAEKMIIAGLHGL
ncbi:MAG TPA: acyl-CoA dehydrogenase family protein [Terriglobia bacterium]